MTWISVHGGVLNYDRQSYWSRISGAASVGTGFIYIYFISTIIISWYYIYLPSSIYFPMVTLSMVTYPYPCFRGLPIYFTTMPTIFPSVVILVTD